MASNVTHMSSQQVTMTSIWPPNMLLWHTTPCMWPPSMILWPPTPTLWPANMPLWHPIPDNMLIWHLAHPIWLPNILLWHPSIHMVTQRVVIFPTTYIHGLKTWLYGSNPMLWPPYMLLWHPIPFIWLHNMLQPNPYGILTWWYGLQSQHVTMPTSAIHMTSPCWYDTQSNLCCMLTRYYDVSPSLWPPNMLSWH